MAKNAKALALILGRLEKPAEGVPPADAEDDGMDEGLVAAAEEALTAMRAGDARAFAGAMKSLISMCSSTAYPDPEE